MAADSSKLQLSYDSCCRLCLSDNTKGLRDVLGADGNFAGMVRRIANTLGIKIDASDKITTSICLQCSQKISNWHTYRKVCVANQTKLDNWMAFSCTNVQIKEEPLDEQEESDIEIVESSEDSQTQFFPGHGTIVPLQQNGIFRHQNEDDMPLASTSNHPDDDDNSMDNNSIDEYNALNFKDIEELNIPLELNSCTCTICYKKFHNPRNKLRHEQYVHGIDVDAVNTSQISGNTDPLEETTSTKDVHLKKASSISESSKIEFAAGLCLQSKSVSPVNKIPSEVVTLTQIEESYLYKCKIMISVFHSNLCYCHNLVYPEMKRMITHLRASSCWYPPFTCYNCMITFNGRSAKMKHFALCRKLRMENLIRLSELRGRDDNKIRLYHNYKCTQCHCIFGFFEDFCDHIYYDHLESDTQNVCTICEKQFENFEQFKQHAFNECYVAHYCDICYVQFSTTEEFSSHCAEKHDNEMKFNFFEVVQNFNVLSNIDIANLLLSARNEANTKLEPLDQQDVSLTEESQMQSEKARITLEESVTHSATACISCENSYSSYHNMIRHLKTAHKFTSVMMQNSLVCPDCGEMHRNLYLLVKHRKIHSKTNEVLGGQTCLTCNESFETSSALRKHIISTHAALLNNIAASTQIEDVENLPLKRKRSKSIGYLRCDECGETFGRASELESHRNSHLNFKLYRDSKTTYRSSLSNEKADYSCDVCNTNFISKQKLNQHAKTHQSQDDMPQLDAETIDEDVKPLICKFCSAAFTKQRELYNHIDKEHNTNSSNEVTTYPRDCIFCNKTISKAGAYANHILMHKRLNADVDFVTKSSEGVQLDEDKTNSTKVDSNDDESDYHTCKRCFKVFTNRYTLKNHMKLHGITMKTPTRTSMKGVNKSTKLYWCNICHQGCQGEEEFGRHKLEHLAEANDQLSMPDMLVETEIVEENKPLVFSCDICTRYFPSKLALRKHKENHINEGDQQVILQAQQKTGFYCKYCKISFSNSFILKDHMASVHDEGPPQKKQKKNNLQQLYSCSVCKKTFSTVGALQSHQGWHKRTKGGKYNSKYMITVAQPMPTKVKQPPNKYFCHSCQIGFKDNMSLQLHTLEVHRNVNATIIHQTLSCTVCNLQFATNADLESHMTDHIAEPMDRKPHPCPYCAKCFSRGDTLAAHEKQYHAELVQNREYKCHLCDRVFDRNNSLAIHLKMHAKTVKPIQAPPKVYSCSICQIRFYLPKDLRNHIITTHPF